MANIPPASPAVASQSGVASPPAALIPPLVAGPVVAGAPLAAGAPVVAEAASCLSSGDGYLRAHLAGAIEADIDWPNSGTHCEGEPKPKPEGIRLSFRRADGGSMDLLFLFGITGIHEGETSHANGVNLTIIQQGTDHIYGTLGDSRCTVDSLSQRPLSVAHAYRVEARGFCTQPAHAVRGDGAVLVSTFDFAGVVKYENPRD